MTFPTTIRCAAWRLTLADGETFVRDYDVPQPEAVALACRPGVVAAEPVGELVTPKPRRRTPRPAAATRPPSSRITPAEIPAEPAGWQWPELLTQITRAHFEGRR